MAKRPAPAPSRGILTGNQPPPITDYIEVVNRLMTNIRQALGIPGLGAPRDKGDQDD